MRGSSHLNNFSLGVIYLIYYGCQNFAYIKGMSKNSKKLVVELGKEMGASDCIELVQVEDYIKKSVSSWVYLWEGGLLSFMEGKEKHDEHILMQFINSWTHRKVNINEMAFEIIEELIARVRGFSLEGNN